MLYFITGITRGLGRALAEKLIARQHTVIGCGRDENALASMSEQFGAPHQFRIADVSNHAQVTDLVGQLIEQDLIPDVVVNNAGIINQPATLWNVPSEEFSQLIDINVKGTYHVLQNLIPPMLGRGDGVLVNFSSGWGRSTSPEVAPYCASKWAIEGLTQALAQELPAEITTISLNPGVIDTDMLRSCWGESAGQFPGPDAWATRAVEWFESISPRLHGQSVSL